MLNKDISEEKKMKRVFVIDGSTIVLALIVFAVGYCLGKREKEEEKEKTEGS